MVSQSIIKCIQIPNKYHYKQEWVDTIRNQGSMEDIKILEIFSFGSVNDIIRYPDIYNFIYNDQKMINKIEKLCLIDISNKYRTIKYEEIRKTLNNFEIKDFEIEEYLIQLNEFFQCKIDSIDKVIEFTNVMDCRDVYCGESELYLVDMKNIVTKDFLLESLNQWKNKLNNEIIGKSE
ncbi:hypothetical protein TBLA_0H00990 [Henningerozyma blattae CBS 6284]|uniref:PCI domain-containing protein n=1 Tax=Henningerozyma blattae (strain ATCC 34711 / CBS 6284 / DSM 70876 / NBRC 10599 / NRRL Y-10934 / UCD 77-7) TaxID=1071380 RepID=I2H7N5_HENB6|nr:hypothetical protein TBLA_0H00990 [Tetrapisispora blattae CBS 6284]CCH62387.1 hypothetical protein TBLA_0H00990 [Tetrapisispora blattae CBS 6284]